MILGITGTNGAGKGAVVEYLVQKHGFTHFSVRDLIVEEVKRRGLELNRITIGDTGTQMRRENTPDYFTRTCIARTAPDENAIIESIRTLSEARYLQSQGGFMVGVDAPVTVRYERIVGRGSHTDGVSFEEFREQEDREYRPQDPDDPVLMNVLGVLEAADYTLINNGTLPELHDKIEEMITSLAKRS